MKSFEPLHEPQQLMMIMFYNNIPYRKIDKKPDIYTVLNKK